MQRSGVVTLADAQSEDSDAREEERSQHLELEAHLNKSQTELKPFLAQSQCPLIKIQCVLFEMH